jgi:hypothetical protein
MLGIFLALVGVAPAPLTEREPEILNLRDKWVAHYNQDACHLIGQFGAGDAAVIAIFTRYQPGDKFDLTLTGKRLRLFDATVNARVDFGIRPDPEHEVALGKTGEDPSIYFRSIRLDGWEASKKQPDAPVITPDLEKGITGVTVSIRGKRPLRLAVSKGFGKPMAALRTCLDDLLKSWGYDPAVQAALSRPVSPHTPPGKWLSGTDYPVGAALGGHNGFVQFRLDIDPEGKIAGCHVLARTNPDDFADTTCRLITRRAKFDPALDAAGKPVRSYFISSVRFMMGS